MPPSFRDEGKTSAVLERIQSLKSQVLSSEIVSQEADQLRAEIDALQTERESLLSDLKKVTRGLARARQEIGARRKHGDDLQKRHDDLKTKLQKCVEQLQASEKRAQESETKLQESERQCREAEWKAGQAEVKLTESEKARNQALARQRKMGDASALATRLEKELASVESERARLSGVVSNLSAQLAEVTAHKGILEKKLDEAGKGGDPNKKIIAALQKAHRERDGALQALREAREREREAKREKGPLEDAESQLRDLLSTVQKDLKGGTLAGVTATTEKLVVPSREKGSPALAYLFDSDEPPDDMSLGTVRQVVRSYHAHLLRNPGEALRFPYSDEPLDYLRQHSHNVCKLAMHLGMHLGLGEEQVLTLGLAAILHDIGMAEVPESIVMKKKPLTDVERRYIREHPAIGARLLQALEGVSDEVVLVVRQHHESLDGTGYPEGLQGDRIHDFARIINLVDGYEAMSAPRVYREELLPNESMRVIAKPLVITQAVDLPGPLVVRDIDHPSPSQAMEQVILQTPQVYDPDLVRSFLIAMGYYPLGSFVRLASGEIARVVATNGEEVKKPVVKIILDAKGRVPQKTVLVNLLKNPRLAVSHAVSGVPYEGLS